MGTEGYGRLWAQLARVDRLPIYLAVGYVGLALALMLMVDLALGWTSDRQPLWYYLFRDGGPSEHLSWFFLGSTALLASATAARSSDAAAGFWGWFAVGAALLVIEDAGNTSHRFAEYLNLLAVEVRGRELHPYVGRLAVYGVLGTVMMVVLLRFRGVWMGLPRVRGMLVCGYLAYGVAALLSVPFNLFGVGYQPIGDAILETVFGGQLAGLPEPIWGATSDNTGQAFVDLVVEESIEVIAASLLATAALRGWLLTIGALATEHTVD